MNSFLLAPAARGNVSGTGTEALQSLATMAAEFGLPALDMSAFDIAAVPSDLVDEELARQSLALPLAQRAKRVFVAIADPANLHALDQIKFRTGLETEPILVDKAQLTAAIDRYRPANSEAILVAEDVEAHADSAASTSDAAQETEADAAPIVRFVREVLLDAVDAGASDIHFEPYESYYRIRLRIDGALREARRPPPNLSRRLAARLKVMAQLNVAERRVPQDGRIKLPSGAKAIDFRVSTLPTMNGEKVVLRVLESGATRLGIDQLGFEEEQKQLYLNALRRPQGMLLVTGPTGSGKTVTLYAGLNVLNVEDRNIATAEDPVEINIEGINQVQVNPKVGLDFATALRAFLRQDPDVVMVGEIRDPETAETAVKAAQTGHLVLSTLHTNSAAETLTRLRNIGVSAFNLATSVTLIVAQRLARRLCERCKQRIVVPTQALRDEGFTKAEADAGLSIFQANTNGCGACDRGYRGRVGICEVVELTPPLQRLILAGGDSLALAEQARALGFDDLRRAALKKVMRGQTSLAEVNRVTVSTTDQTEGRTS